MGLSWLPFVKWQQDRQQTDWHRQPVHIWPFRRPASTAAAVVAGITNKIITFVEHSMKLYHGTWLHVIFVGTSWHYSIHWWGWFFISAVDIDKCFIYWQHQLFGNCTFCITTYMYFHSFDTFVAWSFSITMNFLCNCPGNSKSVNL